MSLLYQRLGPRVLQATGVRFGSAAFAFILSYILIHSAGPERFGAFAVALVTAQLLAPMSLSGMEALLLRLSIRSTRSGGAAARRRYQREAYGLGLSLAFLATVLMAVSGAALWAAVPGYQAIGLSMLLMSPTVFFTAIGRLTAMVLRVTGRDALSQVVDGGIPSAATSVVLMAGILAATDLSGAVEIIYSISAGVSALLSLRLHPSPAGAFTNAFRLARTRRLRFLKASIPIQIANMANYFSDWVVVWLLAMFASLGDVAAYRIIAQVGSVFMLLSMGLEVPYSGAIAKAHVGGEAVRVTTFLRNSRIILLLAGLPLVAVMIVAPDILLALFNIRSAEAEFAMAIIAVAHAVRLSTGASASSLVVLNGSRQLIRASLSALAVSLLVAAALTPSLHLLGAAAATGLAIIVRSMLNLRATKEIVGKPFRPAPTRTALH